MTFTDGFAEKLLLAVIAFLLGLLADVVKRAFQRERKRLAYSVAKRPIIATAGALPQEVTQKLPDVAPINVTEFVVTIENDGSKAIADANARLVMPAGATVIHHGVETFPAKEVAVAAVEQPEGNEVRVRGFTLERKQRLTISAFVVSSSDPYVEVYGSGGGGDVSWLREARAAVVGIEGHFLAGIRMLIMATIITPVLMGIVYLFLSVFMSEFDSGRSQTSILMLASTVGNLAALYFYLRAVPHAVAIVGEVSEWARARRHSSRPGA